MALLSCALPRHHYCYPFFVSSVVTNDRESKHEIHNLYITPLLLCRRFLARVAFLHLSSPSHVTAKVPLDGVDDLNSSLFLYRGVSPQAASVMKVLGFTAPLVMIQEGRTTPPPLAEWNQIVI